MPYGRSYRRKSTRRARPYRRSSAKKGPAVYRTKRVALAKRSSLMRVVKQQKYLTRQSQGRLQMSYQCLNWNILPTELVKTVTDIQNHWILVQGIQAGTPIYSPQVAAVGPPVTLTLGKPGDWVECINPAVKLNGIYDTYDQLKYWSNSLGVQATYCHYSTDYCFNFFAKDCTGWLQIDLIEYRKQINTSVGTNDTYVLPQTALGMINCAQGANDQYRDNPYLFSRKRLCRRYFNTAKPDVGGHYIGTHPNFSIKLRIKNPKHKKLVRLRADSGLPVATTLPKTNWDTISRTVQRWLCVSSTIENEQSTKDANLTYDCYRTNHWRDMLGSVS